MTESLPSRWLNLMLLSSTPTDRDLCEKYPWFGSYNAEWMKSRTYSDWLKSAKNSNSISNVKKKIILEWEIRKRLQELVHRQRSSKMKRFWNGILPNYAQDDSLHEILIPHYNMCFYQTVRVHELEFLFFFFLLGMLTISRDYMIIRNHLLENGRE